MGALLKNPVWLIGAVVVGLLIFAGRKGGGGGDRLGAAIESQRISSGANVALSDITARRDVGMAQAWNDRAKIAAGSQIDFAEAFNAANAIRLSHTEAMRSLAVQERLGTIQVEAARAIALGEQSTMVRMATLDARSRDLATRTAGQVALGAQSTQLSLAGIQAGVQSQAISAASGVQSQAISAASTAAHEEKLLAWAVAQNDSYIAQRRLEYQWAAANSPFILDAALQMANLDAQKTVQLASISASNAQAIASITAAAQRDVALAPAAIARENAETNLLGDVGGALVSGVMGAIF